MELMELWHSLIDGLGEILRFFHDGTVGIFGAYSWAVAIALLTVAVRVVMLPLAVKQFRSMQAMQRLRPEMQRIQKRYKADRGLMRTDPEKYRAQRQKQQEELMALYKEHGVNPAASCLPLLPQMPVFFALFSLLRSPDVVPELVSAPFPFATTLQDQVSVAGPGGLVLLALMGITTFVQQRQMMGRMPASDDQAMTQQRLMLYVMPVFLVFLGYSLPLGILVYWVTTNLWTMAQQWYMLREIQSGVGGDGKARNSNAPPSDRKGSTAKRAESARGGSKGSAGKQARSRRRDQSDASGNGHRKGWLGIGKKRDGTGDAKR